MPAAIDTKGLQKVHQTVAWAAKLILMRKMLTSTQMKYLPNAHEKYILKTLCTNFSIPRIQITYLFIAFCSPSFPVDFSSVCFRNVTRCRRKWRKGKDRIWPRFFGRRDEVNSTLIYSSPLLDTLDSLEQTAWRGIQCQALPTPPNPQLTSSICLSYSLLST